MTLSQDIITLAAENGVMLATAESCTGGMIAAALTDIAGSSVAVDRGFVTYSNAAKMQELGVDAATLTCHGAVSEAVVREMAEGAAQAIDHPRGLAVAVSGVAGPGGGSPEKPVGLVWFGLSQRHGNDQSDGDGKGDGKSDGQRMILTTTAIEQRFDGDRAAIRDAATQFGLGLLKSALMGDLG